MAAPDMAEPRQDHARRAVLSIVGFWSLGAVAAQLIPSPLGLTAHLAAMACGFVFFCAVSQIVAEGTGLRPLDFWNVPGYGKAPVRDRWRLTGRLLRPTWWRRLIGATAGPAPIVAVLLIVTFAACMTSIATSFAQLR